MQAFIIIDTHMNKLILLFSFLSIFSLNTVKAQTDQDTTAKHFMTQVGIANLQEITDGTLAAQKASKPEVKAFGQRMVTDHSKAQATLTQLAKSKEYQLPQPATGEVVPDASLTKATGKDFDRMYVHMMAAGHRQTVLLFQTYAVSGKDPDVKAFAAQTLPILKEHLATITAIDNQTKDSAK